MPAVSILLRIAQTLTLTVRAQFDVHVRKGLRRGEVAVQFGLGTRTQGAGQRGFGTTHTYARGWAEGIWQFNAHVRKGLGRGDLAVHRTRAQGAGQRGFGSSTHTYARGWAEGIWQFNTYTRGWAEGIWQFNAHVR
jgi:hypothetical protein